MEIKLGFDVMSSIYCDIIVIDKEISVVNFIKFKDLKIL